MQQKSQKQPKALWFKYINYNKERTKIMKINNNIPALRTLNSLTKSNKGAEEAMLRLSSGLRINSSKDDTAGNAISNKMDAQIKALDQANRNIMDGISLIQTAEGGMEEVHSMLQRVRELSVQAANDSNGSDEKQVIQLEIDELIKEVGNIQRNTEFNQKNLLDNPTSPLKLQTGANTGQVIEIPISAFNLQPVSDELAKVDVTTSEAAQQSITILDKAIELTSNARSQLGAFQNRLEHTVKNVDVSKESLTSSMSRITDADMALEMAEFTRYNILNQSGTAILAQANQRPESVLQILSR